MKKIWWLIGILVLLLLVSGFREGLDTSLPQPMCSSGFTLVDSNSRCKKEINPTCPSDFPVDANTGKCFKNQEKTGDFSLKTCPAGMEMISGKCYGYESPKCPSGSTFETITAFVEGEMKSTGRCKVTAATATANTTTATTTGTSTGGSSTSSFGPNSGGGRRGQVFGPTFNGIGNDGKVRPMDSSKTNNYPELLGGGDGKPSTRIDGAGIVDPSKNWQLATNGSLPNCTSLGCDENSRYFPYSRQPGDMELIPDPYRVSQQFSAASYSFKTEPTPFLTDFSAFLK